MGCAVRKCVYGQVRTAKAQISLHIHAVWSGPSLSANRIIGYYRMYEWMENKGPVDNLHMYRMIWICAFWACSKACFCFTRPKWRQYLHIWCSFHGSMSPKMQPWEQHCKKNALIDFVKSILQCTIPWPFIKATSSSTAEESPWSTSYLSK